MDKTRGIETIYLFLMCTFFCGLAFSQGLRTTKDLAWPHNIDLYRDIGQAQTIRDGSWWSDPLYVNEMTWYNPLVPGLVAAVSWALNLPVHLVYTRIGTYLNLLAPIALWILVWYLFDLWIAAASLFGFLFVMIAANVPSWASATYSPWLFTANFVQALFYITLITYWKAWSSEGHRWYIVTGILLGITFLGHSAPAVLLGGIIGMGTIARSLATMTGDKKSRFRFRVQPIIDFFLILATAFIVSLPFTWSILGHYHLKIINYAPSTYIYHSLALNNFRSFIAENGNPLVTLVACIGLVWLIVQRTKPWERNLLLFWLSLCTGFILYNYLWQFLGQKNIHLPNVLPLFHFLFYLRALEAILFGCGLVIMSKLIVRSGEYLMRLMGQKPKESQSKGKRKNRAEVKIEPRTSSRNISQYRTLSEGVVLSLMTFIILAIIYPSYLARDDFQRARMEALQKNQLLSNTQLMSWIRKHTQPTDVFLTPGLELYTVGLSGRKIVAVDNRFFSNPYVDWDARMADKKLMLTYLANGDEAGFMTLTSRYKVTHILSLDREQQLHLDRVFAHLFRKEFIEGNISIYRLLRS